MSDDNILPEDGFILPAEGVGLLSGNLAAAGNAIRELERTLLGFGLVEVDADGQLVSNTNLFDSGFPVRLLRMKNELSSMLNFNVLPLVEGYQEYVERVGENIDAQLKGKEMFGE